MTAEIPSTYDHILLGATTTSTTTRTAPFTMWIDDLAIDDKQIGCQ